MSAKEWHMVTPTEDILLPVPPAKYSMTEGKNNITIDILNFGEINLQGGRMLSKMSISSFFPAHQYEFNMGTYISAQNYVDKFRYIKDNNIVFSLFITQTGINKPFTLNEFTWGEEDGSGDIYYSMDLIEHRTIDISGSSGSSSSGSTSNSSYDTLYGLEVGTYVYTVDEGDTLIKIAKWYYGDSSRYQEIADRNNIKNPDLIYPEQVLYL